MAAATRTPDRIPTDYREYDEGEYVFGSSDPGSDGMSTYFGIGVIVRNPFEELGEEHANAETVALLVELASAYRGGDVDDTSHLDPEGPYYAEEFAIEFAVDYAEGEDNEAAYVRLCAETDYLKCHHECGVYFTFRDRFAEAIGVDPSTLYPA